MAFVAKFIGPHLMSRVGALSFAFCAFRPAPRPRFRQQLADDCRAYNLIASLVDTEINPPHFSAIMTEQSISEITFNNRSASSFLNPIEPITEVTEEQKHPWLPDGNQKFSKPLLRIWDLFSGSRPDNNCMSSRARFGRLDTAKARKDSLTIHINHAIWEPTPYISFTTSKEAIIGIAQMRAIKRNEPQTLTVIDPNIRLRGRLPILDVKAEMQHYGIANPYSNRPYNDFYTDHCCLSMASHRARDSWTMAMGGSRGKRQLVRRSHPPGLGRVSKPNVHHQTQGAAGTSVS